MKSIMKYCIVLGVFGITSACSPVTKPLVTSTPQETASSAQIQAPTSAPETPAVGASPRQVVAIEDVVTGEIQRLQPMPGKGLWLITDESVAMFQDDAGSVYLPEFTGTLAGIDDSGRVWVVDEDTSIISAWDGTSWKEYGAELGWVPIQLEDNWYRSVGWGQSDGRGGFWLPTSQDVRHFEGGHWNVITPEQMGMQETGPEDLWASFILGISHGGGTVWVGECDWGGPGPFGGQGVRWFDGSTWRGADTPVATGCANVIGMDPAGAVWLGVDRTVWRFDTITEEWTELELPPSAPDGSRPGYAETLTLDPNGDVWSTMALCGGASCSGGSALFHAHEGVWTPIGDVAEYGRPYDLVFDGGGMPWLAWDGFFYRIQGDTPELMPDLAINVLTSDADGQVWFVARSEGNDVLWTIGGTSD